MEARLLELLMRTPLQHRAKPRQASNHFAIEAGSSTMEPQRSIALHATRRDMHRCLSGLRHSGCVLSDMSRRVRENCGCAEFLDSVHNDLTWLLASISKTGGAMF